jgi:hypothetical protein
MNRRNLKPQRRRVFVGCEGESEQSYVALVQRLLGPGAAIHLVAPVLNGGDPLAIVESALKAIRAENAKGREPFVRRFVFLDSDLRGNKPERDGRCRALAAAQKIELVWQEPCHEAMLLRHLEGNETRRPATTAASIESLKRAWPGYRKGMVAQELGQRIDLEALRRVIRVEDQIAMFLQEVGIR